MQSVSGCYIVYKTTNLINDKIYVGQHYQETSAFDGYLGSGKAFKCSVKYHGKESFIREVLEYCTSANINDREVYWVAALSAMNKSIGYNITSGGEGLRGFWNGRKHTEATKEKMKANNKRIKMSNELKERLIKINLGKKASTKTKQKMSISHKGKTIHTEESKLKISKSKLGIPRSEETKRKISESVKRNLNNKL